MVDRNPLKCRGLLGSALTDSSRRQYQRAWAVFRQFYCRFYGSENPILPLVPNCIPLFISYLSFRKMAYSTINSYLSAISYVHKLKGLRDPTKSFLIQKLLTALSRQRAADVRLPVTKPVLHQLVRSLDFTNSSAWHRSLFGTIFLVALYGLFRIGELVVKSTHLGLSVVQYHSLTFLTACPILRKLAFPNTNTTLPKGHLTFCLLEKTFLLSAQLLLSCSILGFAAIGQVHFSVTLIFRLCLYINSTQNFRGV